MKSDEEVRCYTLPPSDKASFFTYMAYELLVLSVGTIGCASGASSIIWSKWSKFHNLDLRARLYVV